MKMLASTLLASAMLFGSQATMAQPDHGGHGRHDHGHGRSGHYDHRDRRYHGGHRVSYAPPRAHHWERGHRYYGPTYVVRDYRSYRLRPPPRGYHWVRDNNQFLLVAAATGIILDIAMH